MANPSPEPPLGRSSERWKGSKMRWSSSLAIPGPFILYPPRLTPPAEPIIGAAAVHALLLGWRQDLSGGAENHKPTRTEVEQAV
jgi:hypothetical protein